MEKLTNFELEQIDNQLINDGLDTQVRKLVNEVKAYRKLMEAYGIPNLEYLEQSIKRSDKYGELEEKIGCPLEVRCNVNWNTIILDKDGHEWFIEWTSFSHFGASCSELNTKSAFSWNAYKKYWWLKKDKSE